MISRAAIAALLVVGVLAAPHGARAETDTEALARIERGIDDIRKSLTLVQQYAERGELSAIDRANQRFSEAETQFLLDSFDNCAPLLLEVIDIPEFKAGPKYPVALYYLAESFYRSDAFIESLRYFRLAVQVLPPGKLYQDTIVRLLDLSDRTGDFAGVDGFFSQALGAGQVRTEVVYLYGKWMAHRRDLPLDVRAAKADEVFARIQPGEPFFPQALFFRGVVKVTEAQALQNRLAEMTRPDRMAPPAAEVEALKTELDRRLSAAAEINRQILALPETSDAKVRRVRDLANLSLARILYEQGRLDEAAERYSEIPRGSEDYNDAMFETAATFVKMGNFEQALRTAEILLIIGRDGPVLPEAKLLQGNLQMKLQRYDQASATFTEVVQNYSPVWEQIRSLLNQPDPISRFDELLRSGGEGMDVLQLLPAPARPFVKVDRQLTEARTIANELGAGLKGITEAEALVKKLLDTLAAGKLNLFPALQQGNALAIEQSNKLSALEGELVRLQVKLLGAEIPADVRATLATLEAERARLDKAFMSLPQTQEQYEDRRAAFLRRIGELDRAAFALNNKVAELRANLVGLQIYWKSTREQRKSSAQQEEERLAEFNQYTTLIEQLDEQRRAVVRQVETERATISGQANGGSIEEELRARYRKQLATMQELVTRTQSSLQAENRSLVGRIQAVRSEVDALQTELAGLRAKMRQRAQDNSDRYRAEVLAQKEILEGYRREAEGVDGSTRHLVGEIAYDSFSRAARQFHDIVLKADVGLVDIAWTKKRERSDKISEIAKEKERSLQLLQDRFREVLNDAN